VPFLSLIALTRVSSGLGRLWQSLFQSEGRIERRRATSIFEARGGKILREQRTRINRNTGGEPGKTVFRVFRVFCVNPSASCDMLAESCLSPLPRSLLTQGQNGIECMRLTAGKVNGANHTIPYFTQSTSGIAGYTGPTPGIRSNKRTWSQLLHRSRSIYKPVRPRQHARPVPDCHRTPRECRSRDAKSSVIHEKFMHSTRSLSCQP